MIANDQSRQQVEDHRRTHRNGGPQSAQRLKQSFDMLDRIAVGAEDFVMRPAVRQRVNGRDLGQDRDHPLGAFLEQGLADRQGQIPQLVVGRGDRNRQNLRFLNCLKAWLPRLQCSSKAGDDTRWAKVLNFRARA